MNQQQTMLDPETSELNAVWSYVMTLILSPEILMNDSDPSNTLQLYGYYLLGLPITLPLAVVSAPVFLITRHVKIGADRILQKIQPESQQNQYNKVLKYVQKGVVKQAQVSPKTWVEAMQKKLIQNQNKRVVVVNEMKRKPQNKQAKDSEKEFILIVDKDKDISIYEVGRMIKTNVKSETDSIVIMYNNTVLPPHKKIFELESNKLSILKLSYASIETFG